MITDKKTLVVLNPAAGKGKGKRHFEQTCTLLKKSITDIKTTVSEYSGHIREISKQAIRDGYHRIVTIGGDGTPFEVINGIWEDETQGQEFELAMLPAGTGNSLLRDFTDIKYGEILDSIIRGDERMIDVVECHCRANGQPRKLYYLNILGIGLISDILKLTNERLKFLGPFSYGTAVMLRLFKGMNNTIRLKVDGKEYVLKNSALVISNSKYTGGNMKIAPMADTTDGKVDIVVFEEVNRREIIDIFLKVFKGRHIHHPKVKIFSGVEVEIDCTPQQLLMADGELIGETPMKLKVLATKLKVLI